MDDLSAHDDATLGFYARESAAYAARFQDADTARVAAFAGLLPQGAAVLELGCGGGRDTLALRAHGLGVTATDGSPEMAAEAERRTGAPVTVMRFDALAAHAAFDGVWANACLLHVPAAALPAVLARIHSALRPAGLFYASFKSAAEPGRDSFGRYYNYPDEARLRSAMAAAGHWSDITIAARDGSGYSGEPTPWLDLTARKT